jgi:hypothetical protein
LPFPIVSIIDGRRKRSGLNFFSILLKVIR